LPFLLLACCRFYCIVVAVLTVSLLADFTAFFLSDYTDFMYYICRVFGVALPLPVAVAIRILLLTTGGHALIDGIKKLCPELHKKLFVRG